MSPSLIAYAAVVFVALALTFRNQREHGRARLPGPKGVPILGNVLDLAGAASQFWLLVTRWAKVFGDVCYIDILGLQGLLFLSSRAAWDLMEARAAIYSDKPSMVMAGELCGCKDMVAFTGSGDQARRQRKLMQRALGPHAIEQYRPLIEIETHSFLRQLLATPESHMAHARRYAGGLTLLVVYGIEVKSNEDAFLKLAEECVSLLSNEITGGGGLWPVDIFPFLKHIPLWAPGSSFKHKAMAWKAKMVEFVEKPYAHVKAQMANGTAVSSFCSNLLDDSGSKVSEEQDFDIRWTANSMYGASIDTTVTVVAQFILAMVQHPDVLSKAQAEMDAVVKGRLPTFSDRDSLPYIEAIMTETLRWGVPVPLGLPHRLMEDDTYQSMFIPKGTLVFANIWAMSRDETIYKDADAFLPERFLDLDPATFRQMDPSNYVYGFGRRRCPGRHLIDSSLWSLIASMVATLDISKARDEHGHSIEPVVRFDNAVFRIPSPFECLIRPRSEHAVRLVSDTDL